MLLVDDDQARDAASGAKTADRVPTTTSTSPRANTLPLVVPLAVGEAAVLDGDAFAERRAEQRDERRRQRDLRHHQEHLLAAFAHVLRQSQVQLGLAASCHTMEQRH